MQCNGWGFVGVGVRGCTVPWLDSRHKNVLFWFNHTSMSSMPSVRLIRDSTTIIFVNNYCQWHHVIQTHWSHIYRDIFHFASVLFQIFMHAITYLRCIHKSKLITYILEGTYICFVNMSNRYLYSSRYFDQVFQFQYWCTLIRNFSVTGRYLYSSRCFDLVLYSMPYSSRYFD